MSCGRPIAAAEWLAALRVAVPAAIIAGAIALLPQAISALTGSAP